MCTSFTFTTKDKTNFLARTMDFGFELNANPIFIPRDYVFNTIEHLEPTKNAFIGAGRHMKKVGEEYFLADGVNEKGLSVAVLYFEGLTKYSKQIDESKTNIAAHQVILWLLGQFDSITDVKEHINELNIVTNKALGMDTIPTQPLHWVLTDKTGECIVIEPMKANDVTYTEDPVGVMTNAPELGWHLKNLNNYVNLTALAPELKRKPFGNYEVKPWGQGKFTTNLPGGYTPPERFVKVAYLKTNYLPLPNGEIEGVNAVMHILNQMDLTRGSNMMNPEMDDYSQYKSAMCTTSLTYYFMTYKNITLMKVQLTDELLNSKEPKVFDYDHSQVIKSLN